MSADSGEPSRIRFGRRSTKSTHSTLRGSRVEPEAMDSLSKDLSDTIRELAYSGALGNEGLLCDFAFGILDMRMMDMVESILKKGEKRSDEQC